MRGHLRAVGRLVALAPVLAVAVLLLLPSSRAAVPATGSSGLSAGEWFAFDYNITLTNGAGNYSGFTDQTLEQYRYTIQSVVGDNVTVYGHGTWTYSNNSGGSLAGGWTETFSFSSATRLYLWGFDVNGSYVNPSVWFWVPTPLSVGESVRILDSNYTVQSLNAPVWSGFPPIPRLGAELQSSGTYLRNDEYGRFTATWTDQYWFDPDNGLLVAEIYTEHDSNPAGDGFQWQEVATVTSASYTIPIDWLLLLAIYAGIPAVLAGMLVSVRWYHRGPRRVARTAGGPGPRITVRRVRQPAKYLGLAPGPGSPYAGVLPLLLRRAAARKNPVWIATDGTHLVGAMVRDREARVATLYTQDPALAKLFRSMHRARNFFSELPPNAWDPRAPVVETFDVLAIDPVRPVAVDVSAIRPMRSEDLGWVTAMAKDVYLVPEPKWIRQTFEDGDLGFTAWSNGVPAGFAFATVTDDAAILHTLTVAAAARRRGIATALMAARLDAVAALGVGRAMLEISVHNPASLAVARHFGFEKIGEVTYYSRRVRRASPVDRGPM